MSLEAWWIFATFWVIFVTSPGPNAVNCIETALDVGFFRALSCVAAILTQATLFLLLSAFGITALIAASGTAFLLAQIAGAGLLIWLGLRNWRRAGQPMAQTARSGRGLFLRAFLIATINPKSVAGYLAAFSHFVQPDIPVARQMSTILPTALVITAASYTGYTALGAWLGRSALALVANRAIRRGLAACFLLYGLALGASVLA